MHAFIYIRSDWFSQREEEVNSQGYIMMYDIKSGFDWIFSLYFDTAGHLVLFMISFKKDIIIQVS